MTAASFENLPIDCEFTDELWKEVENMQKIYLTDYFSKESRDLHISKLFRRPIEVMQAKVDTDEGHKYDDLKYLIYSAHDTQVVNILAFLKPKDLYWNNVPYASQVVFELFKNESCVTSSGDINGDNESCFYVKTRYNGIDLKLPGCSDLFCKYSEWSDYMDSIWYNGVSADDLILHASNHMSHKPVKKN
eukprot:CAMPEP_0116878456 /NCGR_PEP_ID=MMETSP0463-20121206/10215_1 /TAXON_ID=181622 /ORGANISM="Strombidinopsis sp, Strain SopsisLIS2011" /LENGTH=189 /DNA_ID=CAMNT_0004526713 /DNA_START=703 /DNA_END=1270 /DNA_ORIENTATION=+